MDNFLIGNQNGEIQSKLTQFKEYAVLHPQLERVDMLLMRAIREPAGFAHVLVYGPSGVGKTTMIRQIAKRLNENIPEQLPGVSNSLSYRNGSGPPMGVQPGYGYRWRNIA
jgi:Holliday junction resolvasome RuvABC ATP-dependent DNA helicase subunit